MPDYRKVTISELPDAPGPSAHKKEVDETVGASHVGFNVYTANPGEQIPHAYHYHHEHEEIFYVEKGTIVFQTPDREYRVEEGDAFFVPPGSPQKSRAVGSEPAVVVAVGAPKDSATGAVVEKCPSCGQQTDRDRETEGEQAVLYCAECGAETARYSPGPDDA